MKYHAFKVKSKKDGYEMKSVKGFIVGTPKMVENGDYLVTINPYALPELKNVYPIFGTDARGVDI